MTLFIKNNRLQKDENHVYMLPDAAPTPSSADRNEKYIFEMIASSHDLTSTSYQLKSKIIDVTSEYHLSPKRSNLVRAFNYEGIENVLELGCGSGSITRYLGEQELRVDAVEQNYHLAKSAAARCRELDTVRVTQGKLNAFNFSKGAYDLILCVGIATGIEQMHPGETHEDSLQMLLSAIHGALKPAGVVLIATQNRTGFKYALGAHEDNGLQRYGGIHRHPGGSRSVTYTHGEWEAMINLAGFKHSEFAYPFPDYKLSTILLSDRYVNHDPYAYNHLEPVKSRDYFSIFKAHEYETLFWESAVNTGAIGHFANSFCILLSQQPASLERFNPIDFAHLPAYTRNLVYATQLIKKKGTLHTHRSKLTPATLPPFNGITHKLQTKETFYHGPLLSVEWSRALLSSDDYFDDFENWVKAYFKFLKKDEKEKGFGLHIDLLPSNIIISSEGWQPFDDEWVSEKPVSVDLLIYRAIMMFAANYRPHLKHFCEKKRIYSIWDFIKWAFSLLGLPTDYQHLRTLKKEDERFQKQIADRFNPIDLDAPIIQRHFADRPIVSLFWKREDQEYQMDRMCSVLASTSDEMQTVSMDLPAAVNMISFIRIDPCGSFRKEEASFFRLAAVRVMGIDDSGQSELLWSVVSEAEVYKAANPVGIRYEERNFGRGFIVVDYDAWLEFFVVPFRRPMTDEHFRVELDIRYPRTPEYLLARDRHMVAAEIYADRLAEMEATLDVLTNTQAELTAVKADLNAIKQSRVQRAADKIRVLVYHRLLPKLKRAHGWFFPAQKPHMPTEEDRQTINERSSEGIANENYQQWLAKRPEAYWVNLSQVKDRPRVSIVMPVYKAPIEIIKQNIDSVFDQTYPDWELCIADDASGDHAVVGFLKALDDPRIKIVFRSENGNISAASNSAASLATGEFLTFLDHDDTLHPNALTELVFAAQETGADFIYSDEDFIRSDGVLVNPHFKPDFAPDLLFSQNYITHMVMVNRHLFQGIGGFRLGYEGAQDYDLFLRLSETAKRIVHVAKPLYHWRMLKGSTAMQTDVKPAAHPNARQALKDALVRRGVEAEVLDGNLPHYFRVKYRIKDRPLVSIVIPFKDHPRLLKQALTSIVEKTSYPNFEVIGVSNDSTSVSVYELMDRFQQIGNRIRFIQLNERFNFSRLVNHGVENAQGEHVVLFNNDLQIISEDWIHALLEHSQRREVAVVGAKLYYPDNTIQHAGIAIGLGGCAGSLHLNFPGYHEGYYNRLQIVQNVTAVTGALMMVSKAIYQELNGFDEITFPVAFNDVDFCLKAVKKGYLNIFTPHCKAYHHESKTRGYEVTPGKKQRFRAEMASLKKRYQAEIEAGDPYYNPNFHQGRDNFTLA